MASTRSRCRISLRFVATHQTSCRVLRGLVQGAADLLRRYETLEAILAAGRLVEQSEMLRLYRSIATMDASAPLPDLPDQAPTWAQASDLVRDWELSQLADRLPEMARVNHR